jgi:hypothetical protein
MSVENGAYDPERFARGGKTADSPDVDSDSAGRGNKQQTHSLRLHLADGVHAMQYGGEIGWPWMNHAGTRIEIPSSGRVRSAKGWVSGEWLVVIKGKRLEVVFDQIAEARRLSVRATEGDVPDPKPVIESISVEPMPEEE